MSQNVQQYSKDIYLRASEAQQCQIQSTIVLPLFDSNARKHSIGVLEVVQTAKDMPFAYVIATLDAILQVKYSPFKLITLLVKQQAQTFLPEECPCLSRGIHNALVLIWKDNS